MVKILLSNDGMSEDAATDHDNVRQYLLSNHTIFVYMVCIKKNQDGESVVLQKLTFPAAHNIG